MENINKIKIDKIYVINLEKDIKRKNNTIKTFEKYKIPTIAYRNNYEIIKAHDWSKKLSPLSFKGPRNGGAYGCVLSHLSCIENALNNNYETILIMEDDLMFHKDFNEKWNTIKVPTNWNILYLSATQIKWDNIKLLENENYYKAWKSLGGTAYILKKPMFLEIKKLYKQYQKPIDELLIMIQEYKECIVLYPNLCINYMNESNIRKNNTWKIETTGKRLKWDIDLYDKSIILDENKKLNYNVNIVSIKKMSRSIKFVNKNFKSHIILMNDKCKIYVNNIFLKELNKNDYIFIDSNNNYFIENMVNKDIQIIQSIIYDE